jgi:hypothetical protein
MMSTQWASLRHDEREQPAQLHLRALRCTPGEGHALHLPRTGRPGHRQQERDQVMIVALMVLPELALILSGVARLLISGVK